MRPATREKLGWQNRKEAGFCMAARNLRLWSWRITSKQHKRGHTASRGRFAIRTLKSESRSARSRHSVVAFGISRLLSSRGAFPRESLTPRTASSTVQAARRHPFHHPGACYQRRKGKHAHLPHETDPNHIPSSQPPSTWTSGHSSPPLSLGLTSHWTSSSRSSICVRTCEHG